MTHRSHRTYKKSLESIVRESLVCFGHSVDVLFLLHRSAATRLRIQKLADQPIAHCFFAASAGVRDDPADSERVAAVLADLQRNLVGCAADTSRFDLERRSDTVDGLLKDFQRFFTGLFADLFHRAVKDLFRDGFLALPHHAVDELRDEDTAI